MMSRKDQSTPDMVTEFANVSATWPIDVMRRNALAHECTSTDLQQALLMGLPLQAIRIQTMETLSKALHAGFFPENFPTVLGRAHWRNARRWKRPRERHGRRRRGRERSTGGMMIWHSRPNCGRRRGGRQ